MTAAVGAVLGDVVASWGEGEGAITVDSALGALPSQIDLGGGFTLEIDQEGFRAMMHSPEITAAVEARCQELADLCNSLAITRGAVYVYEVSTNPSNIRGRGIVRPGNYKAVVDEAAHSTMLKALASVGSDPIVYAPPPEGPPASPDVESVPAEGDAAAGEEAAGADAAAEAAASSELADVAVIALA